MPRPSIGEQHSCEKQEAEGYPLHDAQTAATEALLGDVELLDNIVFPFHVFPVLLNMLGE